MSVVEEGLSTFEHSILFTLIFPVCEYFFSATCSATCSLQIQFSGNYFALKYYCIDYNLFTRTSNLIETRTFSVPFLDA